MDTFKQFITEGRKLRPGSVVKVGVPGTRMKVYGKVRALRNNDVETDITHAYNLRQNNLNHPVHGKGLVFDKATGLAKTGNAAKPKYGKTAFIQKVSMEEADEEYEKTVRNVARTNVDFANLPFHKVAAILKIAGVNLRSYHMYKGNISPEDHKREKALLNPGGGI